MWTLLYNGAEKELSDWKVCDDFERERDNRGRATVTLRTTENFYKVPQWVAQQQARIYKDRTAVGNGGELWFQGWFDDPKLENVGGIQHVTYQLHNAWWLLEQHAFQQPRRIITGYEGAPPDITRPIFQTIFTCEVYLGESLAGVNVALQSNGDQIREIIGWFNECFNPTKRGATEGRDDSQDVIAAGTIEPKVMIPVTRAGAMTCAEAMLNVLRLQPDAIVWIDESQEIPELHVRTLAKWNYGTTPPTFVDYTNLPEVEVDITAEQEKKILLQGQTWKALPGVVVWYWGFNTIDGQTVPFCSTDAWPVGINPYTPRLSVHFVELQGFSKTTVTAAVKTEAIADLVDGDQAAQKDWWIAHDKTLQDPKVDPATIVVGEPEVVDATGTPVDLSTYPNILVDTSLPAWTADLGLLWKNATIRAEVAYTKYADDDRNIPETKARTKMIHKSVKVTNAETRPYSAMTEYTPGDASPVGVAESIGRSTNAQQHAGLITFKDRQVKSGIGIGCRLKLVGPTTTFTNILPQKVVEQPCFGTLDVAFGPAAPACLDFLIELMKATRFRSTYRMPSRRNTGQASGNTTEVDTGSDTPSDDTTHSAGGYEFIGVTAPAE